MRRAVYRTDANQNDIVEYLRDLGFGVVSLAAVGGGVPDLLVSKEDLTCLVEVKSDNGKLRKSQEDFIDNWPGQVFVVYNRDDVDRYLT
mgnify:CR=1 FL=1